MIDVARRAAAHGEQTVLFIDEVHRFSKTQQDALLSAVENRVVLLVAATTENPSFSVVAAAVVAVADPAVAAADRRRHPHRGAPRHRGPARSRRAGRGGRRRGRPAGGALGGRCSTSADRTRGGGRGRIEVTVEAIEQSLDKAAVRYDRDGDQHYDVISAFIKSIRGSDVDAALHYLARMLVAGEDPRFVARRLMILASEDIGMADPTALQTAVAAAQTVQLIGMPEAQLTLAHATVHLATAPKSNAVTTALGAR